jgi:hypothetical protein
VQGSSINKPTQKDIEYYNAKSYLTGVVAFNADVVSQSLQGADIFFPEEH